MSSCNAAKLMMVMVMGFITKHVFNAILCMAVEMWSDYSCSTHPTLSADLFLGPGGDLWLTFSLTVAMILNSETFLNRQVPRDWKGDLCF